MSKELISQKARGEIRDFIDQVRLHLETIDLLNTEIAAYDTSDKEDLKRVSCFILARDLVLDEARKQMARFDTYLVYGTQDAEDQSGEEAQA